MTSKLTARGVATAGPGKHCGAGGLRLLVTAGGSKRWVVQVTVKGQGRREFGLGSYPEVSLAEAGKKAAEAKEDGKQGIAYNATKDAPKVPTFEEAAEQYIEAHAPGWSNAKHVAQWASTLATYAEPIIGEMRVDRIGTEDVLRVLKPIWTTKTETAKRVQGRMENILDWAAALKHRTGDNPARWKGHLDKLLPAPSKVKQVEHHPAMPYDQVAAFMDELAGMESTSAKALQLLILTACRTSEVLGATWDEVDLETGIWTIPGSRMKAGREHVVPLSKPAVALLGALPRTLQPYLFPGWKQGRPLSNMALLQLMRGMGYGPQGTRGSCVPHGFRSSFRDWASEVSNFPRDACEAALAHSIADKVEAAYRRGNLLAKRRMMMEQWATYCTAPTATILQFRTTTSQ